MKQILPLATISLLSFSVFSQTPELLKDINTNHSGVGEPSELITYNSYVYFVKDDGTNGAEVWRTDGTTTEMFTDIDNETFGNPHHLTVWNGNLYFSTDIQGYWRADGTPENTTEIVGLGGSVTGGEIIPGENVLFLYTGSYIYVTNGFDEINGVTSLFNEIPNRELLPVGDDLFFVAHTDDEGTEVHFAEISDMGGGQYGSSITILDNVISGSESSDPANLTAFDGKCYWVALKDNSAGNGKGPKGLYESDGTLIGTTEFFTYDPTLQGEMYNLTTKNTEIVAFNSYLFYSNMTGNPYGGNLLKSFYAYNGTSSTALLDDESISGGLIYGFNRIKFYGVIDGLLYVDIPNLDGVSGYRTTDGTSLSATSLNGNQLAHINKMVQLGSDLIFSKFNDDEDLYKSDLSGNESVIYTFTSSFNEDRPKSLTVLGSEVFFIAPDDTEGFRIWKSDGTTPNTERVTSSSFAATKSSIPQAFFVLGGELFFDAIADGTTNLYKTDGTEANTVEVINNRTLPLSGEGGTYGGVSFEGSYYAPQSTILKKLLKFDGSTTTEVTTLENNIENLTVAGSHMYFTSTSTTEGEELWVSDGTDVNTEPLDLFPGGTFSSSPDQLVDVNGVLYFRAVDPNEGTKGLWKSEGTLGTTEVVFSDIIGDIDNVTAIGENVFFTVDDLFIGQELKVYNTTTEEVTKIDLIEGEGDAFPDNLTVFNGYLYLTYQLTYNYQSFIKLDPSNLTSSLLTNFNVTQSGDSYSEFVTTSSFLSFTVYDNITSYSKRVTVSKNDLVSFSSNQQWQEPVALEDVVYYSSSGILYESDGLSDKEIGTISGSKVGFDNFLYFSYEDENLGFEPHKYASSKQGFDLTSSSDIQFTQDESNLDLTWTSGSGDGRLVIASSGAYLDLSAIVDGEVYPADPMYGNESTSLAAGETYFTSHLVANGDIATVGITDLTPGQTYYFTIIEYEEIGVDDFKYDLQGAVTSSFQMEKLDQDISFTNPGETLANETVTLDATSSSGLTVGYSVSGPASISGSELMFSGAGEVTLTIFQNGNTIYNQAEDEVVVFDVVKADQEITFDLPDNATYLDDPIAFTAATDAPISLEYGITGPGQLSIANDEVTITGAGTIEVTVSNDGNNIYNEVSVTESIVVAKADHTITVNEIEDIPYGSTVTFRYGTDPAYELNTNAPPGKSTGLIAINIISGPAEVSETNGQQITVTGVGTVEFEVTNEGNDNFNPAATAQGSFEAIKSDQSISVNGTLPTEISFDEGTYSFEGQFNTLSGDVSYVIISGPGSFSGENMDIYNIIETGEVTVSAFAPSSEFYNGSLATEFTFNVIKGDQEITFEGITGVDNVLNMVYDPEGYELNASASSGLDVTFEVTQNAGMASIDGNLLTVTAVGQFQITMSQSGNENYNAATDVVQTIAIQAAEQTISFEEVPDKLKSDDPFEITAASSAGLDLTYTITQGNNISLNDNVVTINPDAPAGSVTIQISSEGNAVYGSAPPVSLSFCISPVAPTLTLSNEIISSDNMVDQHEWYKDGVFLQVSNNSDNTFSPTESGTYTAIAQGRACPSSALSNEIIYEMVLGLEDEMSFNVFPVPTNAYLNIRSDKYKLKDLSFSIINISGKELINGKMTPSINVSTLPKGVYYLNIFGKDLSSPKHKISFIKE